MNRRYIIENLLLEKIHSLRKQLPITLSFDLSLNSILHLPPKNSEPVIGKIEFVCDKLCIDKTISKYKLFDPITLSIIKE